jgi:ribosomal 30S subunit maturation factor RimM
VTSSPDGWIAIAVLGKTRGNRGELTAFPLSGKPERYQALEEVFLFGSGARYEVESTWLHNGTLVFKFRSARRWNRGNSSRTICWAARWWTGARVSR